MGLLTISATTANASVYNHSWNIPDADMSRVIACYQSAANTSINGTATPQQVFTYVVQQWISRMSQDVVAYGNAQAQAALPPITPISAA